VRYALNARAATFASAALALAVAATSACRRDAQAPLNQQNMFPDAGSATALTPPTSAAGALARAELVKEREPNEQPEEAQAVSSNALIEGELTTLPPRVAKGKKGRTEPNKDADWYRLAATPPGQLAQIDLREGPACAQLELFDDTGKVLIARARTRGGVRPVLPSIGPDAHASLVRVSCDGDGDGAYKLAVFTRPMKPDEEFEPNGVARQTSQAILAGRTLQGTLAPESDVDVFALDLSNTAGVDVWVLSVTAVPGVAMELTLLDPATLEPLLVRKAGKDAGIVVPDLAASRLPKRTLLQLKAVSGQAPDQPYVISLTPLLPTGCARQADCLDRLPSEREPNETRLTAQQLPAGKLVAGFLDSVNDVDTLELACVPGSVVRLVVTPPPELTLVVVVGDGADTLKVEGAAPGAPVVIAGVQASTGRLAVVLKAKTEGLKQPEPLRPNEPWKLESTVSTDPLFELEAGDESKLPLPGTLQHALLRLTPTPTNTLTGWQRSGALVPAGDVDAFTLDLRDKSGPQGLELLCAGDGAPGLACQLLDAKGQELAHLAAGEPDQPAHMPLSLPPGMYRVVVAASKPRASALPYRVTLRDAPEMAQLPTPVSPTAPSPVQFMP
jgi:hypothetical protein